MDWNIKKYKILLALEIISKLISIAFFKNSGRNANFKFQALEFSLPSIFYTKNWP